MSEQLSVEAPEFDLIKKETGQSTRDGIQLLWTVLNEEIRQRRRGDRSLQSSIGTSNNQGLKWLERQTASGAASIELTSFSSTYDNYFFVWHNLFPATDGANVLLTLGDSGGYFSTNYQYVVIFRGTTTALGSSVSSSSTSLGLIGTADNVAPSYGSGYLYGTQQSANYVSLTALYTVFNSSAEFFQHDLTGIHALTSPITKMKFAASSGNISGTVDLYGIAKT